ncbi:unnamed protein product [Symbiodinium microadriaticum]|nr:unnamed protein product [Symbiodinium microadriaticum]
MPMTFRLWAVASAGVPVDSTWPVDFKTELSLALFGLVMNRDDRGGKYKYALVAGLRIPDVALPPPRPEDACPNVATGSSGEGVPTVQGEVLRDDDEASEASWLEAQLEPPPAVMKVGDECVSSNQEEDALSELSWYEAPVLDELPPQEPDEVADGDDEPQVEGGVGAVVDPWEDHEGVASMPDEQFDECPFTHAVLRCQQGVEVCGAIEAKVAHTDRAKELMSKATMVLVWSSGHQLWPLHVLSIVTGCCKQDRGRACVVACCIKCLYLVAKNVRCVSEMIDPEAEFGKEVALEAGPVEGFEEETAVLPPAPARRVTGKKAIRAVQLASEVFAESLMQGECYTSDHCGRLLQLAFGGVEGGTRRVHRGPIAFSVILGAYSHGGLRGITRASRMHPMLCRFMNEYLRRCSATESVEQEWTALMIVAADEVSMHRDVRNEPGSVNHVTHVTPRMMWAEGVAEGRSEFVQEDGQGKGHQGYLLALTQATTVFDPKRRHAVLPATNWVIAGYTAFKQHQLIELGFRLPSLDNAPRVCKLVGPYSQRLPGVRPRPYPPPPGRADLSARYARMNGQDWADLCQLEEEEFERRITRWQRVLGGQDEDPNMNPLSASIPHHLLMNTVFRQRSWNQDPELHLPGNDGEPLLIARVLDFADDGPTEESPFPDRMLMFSIHNVIRDEFEMVILRVEMAHQPQEERPQEEMPPVLQPPGPPPPEVRAVSAVGIHQGWVASQEEVRAHLDRWRPAIEKELGSLKKQGVLVSHYGQEAQDLIANPEKSVSLKGVFTAKAPGGPEDGLYKRKRRLVGCGNQATHVDADSLYPAGAPAEVVRVAITEAFCHQWSAFTTDIKSTFTQTQIPAHAARRYLLRPPCWLVDLGLAVPGEHYSLGMVLYGFKEAPAWWSDPVSILTGPNMESSMPAAPTTTSTRRYRKGYHKHCCGLCTVGHHTARCDKEWRKVQLMPLRGQISECVTAGCCRIAGYSHVHCCTDCVQSGGRLHTGTCQRRQDLAYVVAGTASSSMPESSMEAAGMSRVATTARSPAAMTAPPSLDGVPSRDAVATSTESKPQSVKGTEAVEVSSDESSEESSEDFVLISVTGGATAKMAESASVAAEPKSVPRYEVLHKWLLEIAGWETDGLSETRPGHPVRFLGMQLQGYEDGHFSVDQEAYVDELVRAYQLGVTNRAKIVCPKEILMQEANQVQPFDEGTVKAAQTVAGECLWLSQRTRIDIAFATTVLCSGTHTAPLQSDDLHNTKNFKLHLKPVEDVAPLRVFTDASFAPLGQHSYGGHVVEVKGVPVLWKASRQQLIALSSSEAELIQAVEGSMYAETGPTKVRLAGVAVKTNHRRNVEFHICVVQLDTPSTHARNHGSQVRMACQGFSS